jgi:hypothetical protein
VFVHAGEIRWTIDVVCALGTSRCLLLHALMVWIACGSVFAFANGSMSYSLALCIDGASVALANWTANAVQSVASLVIGAVFVVLAVAADAANEGVALCSLWTLA